MVFDGEVLEDIGREESDYAGHRQLGLAKYASCPCPDSQSSMTEITR